MALLIGFEAVMGFGGFVRTRSWNVTITNEPVLALLFIDNRPLFLNHRFAKNIPDLPFNCRILRLMDYYGIKHHCDVRRSAKFAFKTGAQVTDWTTDLESLNQRFLMRFSLGCL